MFALGIKKEMTQVFDPEGRVQPATLLEVGPMTVVRVKTEEKEGYNAIKVGFGEQKTERINKAQRGLGNHRFLKEFRVVHPGELKEGDVLTITDFAEGDKVVVSAISKGKGFQGVVKRHGFSGGRRSHGQKHSEREPGSIGATGPQRVFKGTRMAGRMGGERVTVKNLKVLRVDAENGFLLIKGAIPGRKGTLVEVRKNKNNT